MLIPFMSLVVNDYHHDKSLEQGFLHISSNTEKCQNEDLPVVKKVVVFYMYILVKYLHV